jgi:acyl dehydratase
MDLSDLTDRAFGPRHLHISSDGVADFVDATGDDPARWVRAAPPGFMSVALFAVAPELLALLYQHSVIHGDQSFVWHRPMVIGTDITITGTVTRARERGGVHFITFEIEASDSLGVLATGSAGFLAAGEATAITSVEERDEPSTSDHGAPTDGQLAASRADLIKYAAATRDWNPIHWDHDAAVEAGLEGIVAQGLLQASWALRAASDLQEGDGPLSSARIRFRKPLPPGCPVDLRLSQDGSGVAVTNSDDGAEYISARIELARE